MSNQTDRIEIRTFPNVTVLAYPSTQYPGDWIVKSMIEAPDSETGEINGFEVVHRREFAGEKPDRERLGRWVREAVLDQLTHELDEGLMIDGVRVTEPHP